MFDLSVLTVPLPAGEAGSLGGGKSVKFYKMTVKSPKLFVIFVITVSYKARTLLA